MENLTCAFVGKSSAAGRFAMSALQLKSGLATSVGDAEGSVWDNRHTTYGIFVTHKYRCTFIKPSSSMKKIGSAFCQADAAILVPDGVTDDVILLAKALGVKQIICCCHEGDDFARRVTNIFNNSTDVVSFVPVAETLKNTIDNVLVIPDRMNKPLRLPVQAVERQDDTKWRIFGRVEAGSIKSGMSVIFRPDFSTRWDVLKLTVVRKNDITKEAGLGELVVVTVKQDDPRKSIRPGDMASEAWDIPAGRICSIFTGFVTVRNCPEGIQKGYRATMFCNHGEYHVDVTMLLNRVDESGNLKQTLPKSLRDGDRGCIILKPTTDMVVDTFSNFPRLGVFVMWDGDRIVAMGQIRNILIPGNTQETVFSNEELVEEICRHVKTAKDVFSFGCVNKLFNDAARVGAELVDITRGDYDRRMRFAAGIQIQARTRMAARQDKETQKKVSRLGANVTWTGAAGLSTGFVLWCFGINTIIAVTSAFVVGFVTKFICEAADECDDVSDFRLRPRQA